MDHGGQSHHFDECIELGLPQFGQMVQQQIGLRSRNFHVAEESQQLACLIDRQVVPELESTRLYDGYVEQQTIDGEADPVDWHRNSVEDSTRRATIYY